MLKLVTSWPGVTPSEFSDNFFSEVMETFSSDRHNSEQVWAAMKAESGKALGNMDFTAWNQNTQGEEKKKHSHLKRGYNGIKSNLNGNFDDWELGMSLFWRRKENEEVSHEAL